MSCTVIRRVPVLLLPRRLSGCCTLPIEKCDCFSRVFFCFFNLRDWTIERISQRCGVLCHRSHRHPGANHSWPQGTDQVPSPSFRWPLDTIRVPNEYSLRPFDGAATVKNGRVSRLSGVIPASGAPFAITVAILRWGVAWGV